MELAVVQRLLESGSSLLSTIRINDIFDILLISIILYRLLWVARKTSAGRLVRGVVILLVAMFVCYFFRLYATNYLLNRVLEWGGVILVVLFQPELRRALERMGSSLGISGIFQQSSQPHDLDQAISETVEAYASMSRDKVGALMVFERQHLLDDVIKTGTALDCSVSSELLKNIFWNKAPLHDGAVIVRNGRIVAAGCMLPMSNSVSISRDLGMRHRAGIGMSEHSDAVVVIVSEETGSISAAVGGMLKRHLAPETLDRLLRNELIADQAQSEKRGFAQALSDLLFGRAGKEGDEE